MRPHFDLSYYSAAFVCPTNRVRSLQQRHIIQRTITLQRWRRRFSQTFARVHVDDIHKATAQLTRLINDAASNHITSARLKLTHELHRTTAVSIRLSVL